MAADRRPYHRAYQSTPEYREKRRLYDQKRYQGARRLRMLAQQKAKRQNPDWKARKAAYDKTYYENRRAELSEQRKRRYALERYGQPTLPPRPKKEKSWTTTSKTSATKSTPSQNRPSTKSEARTAKNAPAASQPAPSPKPSNTASTSGLATVSSATNPPPTTRNSAPWIPSFVDRPLIAPPKAPTVFLCSAGHEFPTRRRANDHSRQHTAASTPPAFRQEAFDFQELF